MTTDADARCSFRVTAIAARYAGQAPHSLAGGCRGNGRSWGPARTSGGLAAGAAGRVLHREDDLAAGMPGLAEFVCSPDLGQPEHLADLYADLAARHQLGDPSQLLRARAHHEQLRAHTARTRR